MHMQGNLQAYLRDRDPDQPTPGITPLNTAKVHSFAIQLTRAMAYLERKFVTHGALCCRHILVASERRILLSGFVQPIRAADGRVAEDGGSAQAMRWQAPELREPGTQASSKADVWSFGVTVWEMFSFGATPHGELDSLAVDDALRRGQRLVRPKHCTRAVYEVLLTCMRVAALDRPLFSSLEDDIDKARDSEFDAVQATLVRAAQADPTHEYEYESDARPARLAEHAYEYEAEGAVRETRVDQHTYEYQTPKSSGKAIDLNAMFGTGATSA